MQRCLSLSELSHIRPDIGIASAALLIAVAECSDKRMAFARIVALCASGQTLVDAWHLYKHCFEAFDAHRTSAMVREKLAGNDDALWERHPQWALDMDELLTLIDQRGERLPAPF